MPNSAAWATWRCTAAVSRNALAGMQPRLRHVPPSASFSTMRHLEPGRRGVQRGGVPAGPATDHHEIELLGRRDHLFRSRTSTLGLRSVTVAPRRARRAFRRSPSSQRTCSSPRRYSSTRLRPVGVVEVERERARAAPSTVVAPQRVAGRSASARCSAAGHDEPEARRRRRGRRRRRCSTSTTTAPRPRSRRRPRRSPSCRRPAPARRSAAAVADRPGRRCAAAAPRRRRGSPARSRRPAAAGCGCARAQATGGGPALPWRRCRRRSLLAARHGAGRSSAARQGARDGTRRRRPSSVAATQLSAAVPAALTSPRRWSAGTSSTPASTPAGHSRCGSGRPIERPATVKLPRSRRQRNGGPGRSTSSASRGAGPTSEFEGFIDKHGLTFPRAPTARLAIFERFEIPVQPALVVIDAAGEVETVNRLRRRDAARRGVRGCSSAMNSLSRWRTR